MILVETVHLGRADTLLFVEKSQDVLRAMSSATALEAEFVVSHTYLYDSDLSGNMSEVLADRITQHYFTT